MPNCRQEAKERMNNGNDSRGARREFDKERRRRNQRSLARRIKVPGRILQIAPTSRLSSCLTCDDVERGREGGPLLFFPSDLIGTTDRPSAGTAM